MRLQIIKIQMNMNKTILIVLTSILFHNSQGQNSVDNYNIGYYFDFNKQPIDGYYDFSYEPEKSLNVNYKIGVDYSPGYYYTREGEKVKGWLKCSQNNTYFKFKSNENDKAKTIKPDQCDGYVIGIDSFAVIENFNVQRNLGAFHSDDREYAEVIEKVGTLTFYKHTRAGLQNSIDTYIVKADSSTDYISFPKGTKKFKDVGTEIFGSFESLRNGFQTEKYETSDIPALVKLLKYKNHYEQQRKVYFNSSWDEVDNYKDCSYYAKVESLKDSVFHIIYYLSNDVKIYEGDFTSLYPHKRTKNIVFFYPNGKVRKEINYKDNKPISSIDYYTNGSIHREYTISKKGNIYDQIYDANSNVILNEAGNGKESIYDSINNREITYEYVNHALKNAYYFDSNGRRIFQLCEKNAKLKAFRALQLKLNNEVDYPIKSVKDFNHGYVLVKFIIEPTGLTSNFEIVKSVDSACDSAFLNFISFFKTYKHWKPAQYNKEKVAQELVIPIEFSIISFSRYTNFSNNFMMMQNSMMQNMMMQNMMMQNKMLENMMMQNSMLQQQMMRH